MRARCTRCDDEAEPVFQHPRLRRVLRLYLLLPIPFIPFLPIIASDYVVMIPMLMVYMLGLGPVFAIIQEPPTCSVCGANLERPSRTALARLLGY